MLTNYLRELLTPIIKDSIRNDANTISNRYIADMKSIHNDLYDIRMRLQAMKMDDVFNDIHKKIDRIEALEIEEADLEVIAYKIAKYLNTNTIRNNNNESI